MVAFGNRPANFNGAPIEPLPEQPPEHRRNKYGGFGTPITPEIDEKIHRLKIRGLNSREISAELAREDI